LDIVFSSREYRLLPKLNDIPAREFLLFLRSRHLRVSENIGNRNDARCRTLNKRTEHRSAALDRDELKKPSQSHANTAQVRASDRALVPGVTGREDDLGADPASPAAVDVDQPIGAQPRSDLTGQHEPGMGANDTVDGLSGTEEAVRAAAEDETEADELEDTPVFDRADVIPKII
jgi:hypothetical protein